jgi:hypothetical protein
MKTFAFLRKNPLYGKKHLRSSPCGKYNGYVGIIDRELTPTAPEGLFGDYITASGGIISVHGNITYDSKASGFELPHDGIIPLTEIPHEWWQYQVVGFDCNHWGDTPEKWPFEEVKKETLDLQRQIEEPTQ